MVAMIITVLAGWYVGWYAHDAVEVLRVSPRRWTQEDLLKVVAWFAGLLYVAYWVVVAVLELP
jgi:hypothetical protein